MSCDGPEGVPSSYSDGRPWTDLHDHSGGGQRRHSGATIKVAPGIYTEQVMIPSTLPGLTIQAQNGQDSPQVHPPANSSVSAINAMNPDKNNSSIIVAPPSLGGNLAIVDDSASNFHLTGFVIEGPGNGIGFGVLVEGGATSVQIDHNHILHITDPSVPGSQHGFAVEVNGGSSATITQNLISDYQKDGIHVTGAGTVGTITNNVVGGDGPISALAQNGILFDSAASGSISSNLVTGNVYTGLLNAGGSGIILFYSGQVNITNNIVYSDDENIVLDGPSNTVATSLRITRTAQPLPAMKPTAQRTTGLISSTGPIPSRSAKTTRTTMDPTASSSTAPATAT